MNLSQEEYEALARFRYAIRKFLRFSEQKAREADLTPQQHQALLAVQGLVGGREGATVGELAERLQLRHHSTVGLVDRLEKNGLMSRLPNPEDRRQVLLSLTEEGFRRLETLSRAHRDELNRIGPEIREVFEHLSPHRA